MALSWAGTGWAASTAYILGARIVNGTNVYVARAAGTSAASGGPTGTGTGITDGMVTWDYVGAASVFTVVAVAPELAAIAAASQALVLEAVQLQVNPDVVGVKTADMLSAYLAAHIATLVTTGGRGPALSDGLGPFSSTYASMMTLGALGLTSYGVEYRRLVRLTPVVLGAVP